MSGRAGDWELIELVGQGGFSEVWRARRGSTIAAIKLLKQESHVRQLREEASSLALVSGRGVVPVIEVALDRDPPYLALAFLSGGNLRAGVMGAQKPNPARMVGLFEKLLEVLARVHSEGVVHGDLKPENVLFDEKGELHLADFGLSRRIARRSASLSVSLSATDAKIAGTLDYMAPEQRRGEKPTTRSDVYAAGVLLHELLTGERPLGVFRLPSELDARVPPVLDRAVACALSEDPSQRFADARAMLDFLREGLANDWKELVHAHGRLTLLDAPRVWQLWTGIGLTLAVGFVALRELAQAKHDTRRLLLGLGIDAVLFLAAMPWVVRYEKKIVALKKRLEKLIRTKPSWDRSPAASTLTRDRAPPVLKSSHEIAACRRTGQHLEEAFSELEPLLTPGTSIHVLDSKFQEFAKARGLELSLLNYRKYPTSISVSINHEVHHAPASFRVLADGDVVKLQLGLKSGFHASQCWTYIVGSPRTKDQELLAAGRDALARAIAAAKVGGTIADLSGAIEDTILPHGFDLVREYGGHGIGRKLHEPPFIPCCVEPTQRRIELVAGMVLSIHVIAVAGSAATRVLNDRWTVVTRDGSHAIDLSQMIAIREEGPLVLTRAR